MAPVVSHLDVDGVLAQLEQHRATREAHSITTAFNLVAFIENDDQLREAVLDRIAQIGERNPLRSIVITAEETRLHVGMEHVELPGRDIAAVQLESIVHELRVPAVRTVLVWAGSDLSDPRFATLAASADVVILFTSRTAASETNALREVVKLLDGPLAGKIRDLAFLRLLPWQEMVAQLFDEPDLMPELERIRSMTVRCGTDSEAYYFAGWIASRLQWQPCGANEFCNAGGEKITVALHREGEARRMYGVEIASSAGTTFEASLKDGYDDIACLKIAGKKARPERCAPLQLVDIVTLIEHAIFMPDESVYPDTLRMVGRLLEHLA